MENKICVYAICKNEKKFVDKWLESMSEADYIVVLDTGSTDGTYEKLKGDSRVTRAEQQVISPWRFDVARNESLKLVPEDANILICTDLDEVLEPGWATVLRENWIDGYHVRGWYKYAWSHTPEGKPALIFYYDKIHDRNWKWYAPVHELLQSDVYDDAYTHSHALDLFDKGVYLHHYPDPTKSRSSYLPLLELRAKENPDDYYGKFYLSHEYYYRGMYNESIELLNKLLTEHINIFSNLEIAACYLFLGDNYKQLGFGFNNLSNELRAKGEIPQANACKEEADRHYIQAITHYNNAIYQDKTYREPYLYAAEMYNELGQYRIAIAYVESAIANSVRHYSWIERGDSWIERVDDILSISYYYLGDINKSKIHVANAYLKNPSNERVKSNLDLINAK